jgi:hypothetical protein
VIRKARIKKITALLIPFLEKASQIKNTTTRRHRKERTFNGRFEGMLAKDAKARMRVQVTLVVPSTCSPGLKTYPAPWARLCG